MRVGNGLPKGSVMDWQDMDFSLKESFISWP